MHKVVFAACLLLASALTVAKDPTQLMLHKGARVGIVNIMDAEITHFHTSKNLSESFFKTHLVNWNVDSMLVDAVSQRLTQVELVAASFVARHAMCQQQAAAIGGVAPALFDACGECDHRCAKRVRQDDGAAEVARAQQANPIARVAVPRHHLLEHAR